jgi:hypothetical protein
VLARKTGEDVLQAHSSSWGPPFWFSFATFMVHLHGRRTRFCAFDEWP